MKAITNAVLHPLRRSPGEAAANPGLLVCGGGHTPHDVNVLQLRRLLRVLVIIVQCKTREPKKRSPERGLISRGHTGSYLAGVQLENYPSTTLPRIAGITGTTPKSFFECDIDATTASVGDVGSTRLRL